MHGAADRFDVMPDLITCAKGITNGCVPMGAVLATSEIHDAFMHGPDHLIELFHGLVRAKVELQRGVVRRVVAQ